MSKKPSPQLPEDRLRRWVHSKFNVWITHANAMKAIRYIVENDTSHPADKNSG